ncbi:MAG: hypothetical protein IKC70_08880 [Bacteroidaceae bacterium]|nr:hypothetical protein [Bacteroidaceae bacterium]
MKDNKEIYNVSEEYNSDNIDDIIRERKKNQALREIFPYLFNEKIDNTIYHLIKHKNDGSFSKIKLDDDFFYNKNKQQKNKETNVVNDNTRKQRSDSLFYKTIPTTLNYEGGFVNNPLDRGGKTNMGITQKFLNTYKNKAGISVHDVKDLTNKDAIKLYKAEWDTYGFGLLDNTNVMKLVHDFSVHSGPYIAITNLQHILNKKGHDLIPDGYIGKKTNNAVNSVNEKWLKTEIQKYRAQHCDNIVDRYPEQKYFIKGWFNRINDISRKCGCDTTFKSKHF